jgi:hypothetical protein
MSKRLLDHDPLTGITTYHHFDPVTGIATIETEQDMEPFIERNKAMQNDADYSKSGMKNEFWYAASIPINVQYQWLKEGIDIFNKDHWQAVRKKLNDPDWKYLRTATGRV